MMIKRVFLFLLTNFAVIIVLTAAIMILEIVFWINITSYLGWNYTWLLIFAAIFGFGWAFISLALSRWSAKRAYNIQVVSIEDYYNLNSKEKIVFDVVKDLAERNNITLPEIGFYNSPEPNAFATWASKNSSLVAVSSWLLDLMDKDAIEWVIGHEMAHVLNGDMVTMTLLQWVLNTFVIFISRILAWIVDSYLNWNREWNSGHSWSYFIITILFEIIFWILASMIAMWFSRYREFRADAWSAEFVWKEKMIAWLEALKKMQAMASWENSKLATMKISTKWRSGLMYLFSSHPDLDDRIKALEELRI
jgi:heat shock protein HtpX